MDERVWEKTAQFLKELRCEDTGRLSQLQLPEYQKAVKEKFSYRPIYEQTVSEVTEEQKRVIREICWLNRRMCGRRKPTSLSAGNGGYAAFTIRKRNIESSLQHVGKNQAMEMIKRFMHVHGPLC